MDYYAELALSRSASEAEVKKAYRKLALKHHPDKDASPAAATAFARVAEAYDVLSEPRKKGYFDLYGEEGLKVGVPDGKGGKKGGFYAFETSPLAIFEAFFGTANPYAALLDISSSFSALTTDVPVAKGGQKTYHVSITLEDVFFGGEKNVQHTKDIFSTSGAKETVTKTLTIHVPMGCTDGRRFVFEKEGNQKPNIETGPVIVVVNVLKHATFERKGTDLVYYATLPLAKALAGSVVSVKTLDNRTINVPVMDIVTPSQTKVVAGEGLPDGKGGKGDLVIVFDLLFPRQLSQDQKTLLKAAFYLPSKPCDEAKAAVSALGKAYNDTKTGWATGFPA